MNPVVEIDWLHAIFVSNIDFKDVYTTTVSQFIENQS